MEITNKEAIQIVNENENYIKLERGMRGNYGWKIKLSKPTKEQSDEELLKRIKILDDSMDKIYNQNL